MRGHKRNHPSMRFVVGIGLSLVVLAVGYGIVRAAGDWDDNWSDSPDWGYQNWTNLDTQVRWSPAFMWTTGKNLPTSNRRIELEWYDPGAGNFCDRLEPFYLQELGGDWVDTWATDNQCGTSVKERLVFDLKESNLSKNTWYQVAVNATKKYSASYGGECNVSFTCFLCSDDWLGKQLYTASYDDAGSTP